MTENQTCCGQVVAIRGGVVDVFFEKDLPPLNSLLLAGDGEQIVLEVALHLTDNLVRGTALTTTHGLALGSKATASGRPLTAPVGKGILGRVFNVFGQPIDCREEPSNCIRRPVHGRPLALEGADKLPSPVHDNRCRVYNREGSFLAMLRFDGEKGQWQPEKVFAGAQSKDSP